MKQFTIILFLSGLGMLLFHACDSTTLSDEFRHISSDGWTWEEPVVFEVELMDTTSEYNILLQLRHTTDYPMSNLYMFVDVAGPSGQTLRDTVQFFLARPDGEWIGKGTGKSRELRFLYRERTRFPETGNYRFRIEQAMRVQSVPVTEVGLRIDQYQP